jgi:hypothetical protein
MIDKIKRIFCLHQYKEIECFKTINNANGVPMYYLTIKKICKRCGKVHLKTKERI